MAKLISKNLNQTKTFAQKFAKEVLAKKNKNAIIVGLQGDLGAGKTTFTQLFAKALKIKNRITSPTFVLMKRYKIPKKISKSKEFLYHIDCYRLNNTSDIIDLGFKEMISVPQNIIFIEWAEKIKNILPKNTIWLKFKTISFNEREIIYNI